VKNSFFLLIPKQQDNPQRLREFEPKLLQHWLADLPVNNYGLITRLIRDLVIDLNATIIPSGLRLKILETIRPHVHHVEEYLQSCLVKTGFPKDEAEIRTFDILVAIQKNFAIGYWTVLKDITRRNVSWLKGKDTALVIQRCIDRLALIVCSYHTMRVPTPDWIWIDLHSLYSLSVAKKCDTAKIANSPHVESKARPIEAYYKQIVLLNLADPSGLMQKEIVQIFHFAGVVAPLINLQNFPVVAQKIQCIIQLDEDHPPYFQSANYSKSDLNTLYIDFTVLNRFFDHLSNLSEKVLTEFGLVGPIPYLSVELLVYLRQRWLGIELQGSLLFADRLDRYITMGLFSTYDMANTNKDVRKSSAGEVAIPEREGKVQLLAETVSDRLLSAVFEYPGLLSVGSLVSFRKQHEPECNHALGIVNKVNTINPDGSIVFGLLLLAKHYCIVFCKRADTDDNERPQRGAFYATTMLGTEREYIITDYPFDDEELVHLSMENAKNRQNFPIVLDNKKNIGLGYWHFECYPATEYLAEL
jgi:cyclic-di-GMP-binding protein